MGTWFWEEETALGMWEQGHVSSGFLLSPTPTPTPFAQPVRLTLSGCCEAWHREDDAYSLPLVVRCQIDLETLQNMDVIQICTDTLSLPTAASCLQNAAFPGPRQPGK